MLDIITNIINAIIVIVTTIVIAILSTQKRTDKFLNAFNKHRIRNIVLASIFFIVIVGVYASNFYFKKTGNLEQNFYERYDEKVEEIVRLKGKISKLDIEKDSLQNSYFLVKSQLDSISNIITLKQNQKNELASQINDKQSEKDKLNEQLQRQDPRNVDQIAFLKSRINQLETEIQELKTQKEKLENEIKALEIELKDLNQKNEDLKSSLANSSRERQELESRLKKEHDIYATRIAQSDSIISLLSTKQDQSHLTHQIVWSPDNKWLAILYSSGKISRLLVIDVNSRTGILDSLIQKNYQHLKFSTDGDKIFLNSDIINLRKQFPTTRRVAYFRSQPKTLSSGEVKSMLKKYDYYESNYNPNGRGFANHYRLEVIQGDKVIIDQSSCLMWQQGGSDSYMYYDAVMKWIDDLNKKGYAGFYDWRLPTLEEAMALMESKEINNNFYIDPVFDKTKWMIWTADELNGSLHWYVSFLHGRCGWHQVGGGNFVRAVRSGQSSQK